MSLLPFLIVAFGAGTASLLARHRADLAGGIGIAGLALASLAAASTPILERLGAPFAPGEPGAGAPGDVAVLLLVAAVSGLLIVLAGAGTGTVPRSLPGATLLTLGWGGLALATSTPQAAIFFATAAGLTSVLPLLDTGAVTDRGAVAAVAVVRVAVVAGIAAWLALLVPAGADGVASADGDASLALLAAGAAVAVRLGVVPLHRPNARLANLAPPVTLPLALVVGPAIFALAMVWGAGTPADVAGLGIERGAIVVVGLASAVLGTVAALLHDDLEHVLAYAVAADGGLALLALGASAGGLDGAAWTWLLALIAGRTALAGWVVAVGGRSGSRRLGDLGGWARRSPLLAVALGAIAVAAVGWPDSPVFAARQTLVDAAVGTPLAVPVLAVTLTTGLVYGRLLLVGFRRPPPRPRDGPEARPVRLRLATVAVLALAALAVAVSGGFIAAGGG